MATAEKELEKSIRNEDLLQADETAKKTLVYFNTSIRGNEVMIGRLKNIFQDTDYLDLELLEDVVIELKQAYNTVNIYSDILTGTMDAFASIISNNVNAIMKRMTSLSITLMIPTLIASFYGMNVDIHLEGFPHAFCVHCVAVRNIIGRDLYMVQKDQMVLKIRVRYRHQYFNTFADTVLYLGIVIPIEAPI